MPSIVSVLRRFTNQYLVYWQKCGSDTYGKAIFLDPIQLPCRWEDKNQEIILAGGRKVISKTYALLATPVTVGSLIFLGTLEDWKALPTYPEIPTNNQGTREVLQLKITPDIKARGNVYEAMV